MKHTTWVGLDAKQATGLAQDLNPIQDAVAIAAGKTEAVARSIQDMALWADDLEKTMTVGHSRLDAIASHMAVMDSRPVFDKAEFERRLGAEVASIRNETALRIKALESATKTHFETVQGDLNTLHSLEQFLVEEIRTLKSNVADQVDALTVTPQAAQQKASTWPSYVAMVLAILAIALHFLPL